MNNFARSAGICLAMWLLCCVGRYLGATCTTDCEDIEAFRQSGTKCYVWGTDSAYEADTVGTWCSKQHVFSIRVDAGYPDADCFEDPELKVAQWWCPLSLCTEMCQRSANPREMGYTTDADPSRSGKQIDVSQCRRLSDKLQQLCDVSPSTSPGP